MNINYAIKMSVNVMLALMIMSLFSAQLYANVVATRGGDRLMQADINNMIHAGEQIAQQVFTTQEKQALRQWGIEVFKKEKNISAVKSAYTKYMRYRRLANQYASQDMKRMVWHHFYREMTFKWRFPTYRKGQMTLLGVIQRYNPIVVKLSKEKMILAKKDQVFVRKGQYFLSRPMWTALSTTASFLARANIRQQDLQPMYQWSVADFNKTPREAMLAYANFFDNVVPMALSPVNAYTQEQFRSDTYQSYFFLFKRDPLAQQWKSDLMDVVVRYNPTLIIDHQRKQLVSRSELDDHVALVQYFNQQLQLGINISSALRESERKQLINRFISRKNKQKYYSSSSYLRRTQSYWAALSAQEQQILATQVRGQYQQSKNIWTALKPVFAQLDSIIRVENQQKLAEQQLMAGILMQNLQLNQMIFNNTLQAQKAFADTISNSIKDFSTRQSIHISGGKIINSYGDRYIVESAKGERYEISK